MKIVSIFCYTQILVFYLDICETGVKKQIKNLDSEACLYLPRHYLKDLRQPPARLTVSMSTPLLSLGHVSRAV